jgi:hypothetical protein
LRSRHRVAPPQPVKEPVGSRRQFVGVDALKAVHKAQVEEFQAHKDAGSWDIISGRDLRSPGSHFDWWAFPIPRNSDGRGEMYNIRGHVDDLKDDLEFIANLRKGAQLMAESWGWDLANSTPANNGREWSNYAIRLTKMRASLETFGQRDLVKSLDAFMAQKRIRLS